jgi:predicted Zn-dependent protease
MSSLMRRSLAFSAVLAFLLSTGCATVASVTEPATRAVGELLLSPEDERRLGNQLAAQVRQKENVLDDPGVQRYVDQLGQRLVAQAPRAERRFDFQFTVLEGPDHVNAFALPGGHIFVYSGLIQAAHSEAELASVLAHEVAHVTAGHPADLLAAQVGLSTLQELALGRNPALLVQLGSAIASQGYLAAYSRDQEQEADKRGLQFLAQAGYEPSAMARFFQELAAPRADRLAPLSLARGSGPGRQAIIGGFARIQERI